jgi:hypothetical protein
LSHTPPPIEARFNFAGVRCCGPIADTRGLTGYVCADLFVAGVICLATGVDRSPG